MARALLRGPRHAGHDWRESRRLAPEVWLLCERELGGGDRDRYYLVHLPATASLRALVQLAHPAEETSRSKISISF
ncbi:hypothetical protein [Luteitalea pratensis]|uniref:hypothetical protein n=1 Tax=Luteitalea pratensis TaxID=1855912 RepID=UPI0012FFC259|nr:hypothetical protein [Luteitalea pratensis]